MARGSCWLLPLALLAASCCHLVVGTGGPQKQYGGPSCACPLIYMPVCASNNKTYANMCEFECARATFGGAHQWQSATPAAASVEGRGCRYIWRRGAAAAPLTMKVALAVCMALLAVVLVQAEDEMAPPIRRGAGARITNGRPATPKLLPYMAYIEIPMRFGFTWYCAGSLITRSAVLTAASCLFTENEYAVRLGSIYLREEDPNAWSVVSRRAMVHPKYNQVSEDNNIAIIQLPRLAPLNEFIQPVYLPCSPDDSSYADQQAIVSGWGQTSPGSEMSDVLLWVEVLVTHNDNCKKEFPKRAVTDRQLCAGNLSSTAYTGDYGAPLVLYNRGRYIQIGIFSDHATYNKPLPALYTRVTSFMDWIKMMTESD